MRPVLGAWKQWASAFLFLTFILGLQPVWSQDSTSTFDVSVFLGLPYSEGPLELDLYNPGSSSTVGVLFLHGGGFSGGRRDHVLYSDWCSILAKNGFTTASASYRLRQKDKGFGCDIPIAEKRKAVDWAAQDALTALRMLKTNPLGQSSWPEKWVLAGSSAGAEAVLHAGYSLNAEVVGIVSFSGALDASSAEDLAGQLDLNLPALLAIHGRQDRIVPFGAAVHRGCDSASAGAWMLEGGGALCARLKKLGISAELIALDEDHSACNSAMQNTEITQKVLRFLRSQK